MRKTMLIKTILNNIEKFKSFVYDKVYYETLNDEKVIIVELKSRKNSKGKCHDCGKSCGTYDTQPVRDYEFVPLWGIPVYFRYAPRRISCRLHRVHIEQLPWKRCQVLTIDNKVRKSKCKLKKRRQNFTIDKKEK